MNLDEITRGQRVTYIPPHAKTPDHPDREQGIVTFVNASVAFVLFDKDVASGGENARSKSCYADTLHLTSQPASA